MDRDEAERRFLRNAQTIDRIAKHVGPTSVTALARLCGVHRDTIVKHWRQGSTRCSRGPAPEKREGLGYLIDAHLRDHTNQQIAQTLRLLAAEFEAGII